jgi:hypothetical protein
MQAVWWRVLVAGRLGGGILWRRGGGGIETPEGSSVEVLSVRVAAAAKEEEEQEKVADGEKGVRGCHALRAAVEVCVVRWKKSLRASLEGL